MRFGLKLVTNEEEETESLNSSRLRARKILANVYDSGIQLDACLHCCNELAAIAGTPLTYWEFARNFKPLFAELFGMLKPDKDLEEGLRLANIFVMLVYLRKINESTAFLPSSMARSLIKIVTTEQNCDLCEYIDQFAHRIVLNSFRGDTVCPDYAKQAANSTMPEDLSYRIRRLVKEVKEKKK